MTVKLEKKLLSYATEGKPFLASWERLCTVRARGLVWINAFHFLKSVFSGKKLRQKPDKSRLDDFFLYRIILNMCITEI